MQYCCRNVESVVQDVDEVVEGMFVVVVVIVMATWCKSDPNGRGEGIDDDEGDDFEAGLDVVVVKYPVLAARKERSRELRLCQSSCPSRHNVRATGLIHSRRISIS